MLIKYVIIIMKFQKFLYSKRPQRLLAFVAFFIVVILRFQFLTQEVRDGSGNSEVV